MRALVQRVHRAHVEVIGVDGSRRRAGTIGRGLCVLVGVTHEDDIEMARRAAQKVVNLRLWAGATPDDPEQSCLEIGGAVLVVSQFTLYADTRKGRRPSFVHAARPEHAEPLVDAFVAQLVGSGVDVQTGEFGAMMDVDLTNDGPYTVMVEL